MQKQFNELMEQKNWHLAFDQIEHYAGNDEKILHIKSLLCRFYNQYDIENNLVDHALTLFPCSLYMKERKQWHNISWFKRLSPRPGLHLPRDQKYIPKQQTLDSLCIVMAANDKYFELLIECIESIKATRFYKHIDIKILDVGLTRQQYFLDRWDIEVIAPGWPVECEFINFSKYYFKPPFNVQANNVIDKGDYYSVPCDQIRYAQAVLNKPFLHKLFSGYDYYLWIDADCWIQDERGLDRLISLAEKQGYAFPGSYNPKKPNPDLGTSRVPSNWASKFEEKPNTVSSIYCNSRVFQKKWADNYKKAGEECGFWWGQEEEVASYSMKKKSEIIDFTEVLYLYRHLGFPVVKSGENILRNPENLNIIPVFGLGLDKQRYFYPVTQCHEKVLPQNDLLKGIKAVGFDIDWSKDTPYCFTDQKLVSFRYRCMPNHSYVLLEEQLEKQPNLRVEQELDIASSKIQYVARKKEFEIYMLSIMDKNNDRHDLMKSNLRYLDMESTSNLKTHEFIALREAQIIVKMKDKYIQKLELALQEAQNIVKEQAARIPELDVGLQEAQKVVKEQVVQIKDLDIGLQEAQGIVNEQVKQIKELDIGLKEAQGIVNRQVKQIKELDIGLKEAQGIVYEQVIQIKELDEGFHQAQGIVKEQVVQIQKLDIGLQEAQNIVKQRNEQVKILTPALKEAQGYVWKRESEIQILTTALLEAQNTIEKELSDK